MTGASENHKVNYIPRTLPKTPEELQRLILPLIEWCKITIGALDASNTNPKDFAFLDFMEIGRKVLLQGVAQLINIGCTHILFDHDVFKTEWFLNYKETLGTLFSTSVNPVYLSLNSLLPELSIKLANLHSDVNGHQKTIIDFLCSNFRQINDIVITAKNDFSRSTTVSDMQNLFNYCSWVERGSNSHETLADEIIDDIDKVVNVNSFKNIKFGQHDKWRASTG